MRWKLASKSTYKAIYDSIYVVTITIGYCTVAYSNLTTEGYYCTVVYMHWKLVSKSTYRSIYDSIYLVTFTIGYCTVAYSNLLCIENWLPNQLIELYRTAYM